MKLNKDILDISHETIQDDTDESLVISIKNINNDDDFEVRFHLNGPVAACIGKTLRS